MPADLKGIISELDENDKKVNKKSVNFMISIFNQKLNF